MVQKQNPVLAKTKAGLWYTVERNIPIRIVYV